MQDGVWRNTLAIVPSWTQQSIHFVAVDTEGSWRFTVQQCRQGEHVQQCQLTWITAAHDPWPGVLARQS